MSREAGDSHDHASHADESSGGGCEHEHEDFLLPRNWLVGLSGGVLAVGVLMTWLHVGGAMVPKICFALATLAGGLLVFPAANSALKKRRLDMNVLMVVAVAGAWLVGEGEEGAAVVFLFALSELLESLSVGRARRAIESLLKLSPETALLEGPGGDVVETPVAEIGLKEIIRVPSGQRVPMDGTITEGHSSVNQAPITGESVPVEKQPGDPVFAGSINGEGSLEVMVTRLAGDSTLSRIIRLVRQAEEDKAPTQRFVDRFAGYYTPATFAVALLVALVPPLFTGGWHEWAYRALVLLVIACPCALVIATPVSIVSGLTALARHGVLVKGGAHLEAVGKLKALAVDKTGTITHGKPRVTGMQTFPGTTEARVLRIAAVLDTHSEHPLARAIVEEAREKKLTFVPATDYRARSGRGAEGMVDGHPHFVGNHRMAHELGVCTPELEKRLAAIESGGASLAVVGHLPHGNCPGQALGVITIADTVRPDAGDALRLLREAGLKKVVMLSGDNRRTVDAIARLAGIEEAHGDLLPEQKNRTHQAAEKPA